MIRISSISLHDPQKHVGIWFHLFHLEHLAHSCCLRSENRNDEIDLACLKMFRSNGPTSTMSCPAAGKEIQLNVNVPPDQSWPLQLSYFHHAMRILEVREWYEKLVRMGVPLLGTIGGLWGNPNKFVWVIYFQQCCLRLFTSLLHPFQFQETATSKSRVADTKPRTKSSRDDLAEGLCIVLFGWPLLRIGSWGKNLRIQ